MFGEMSTTIGYNVMLRNIPVNTLSYQELLSYESGGKINRSVATWSAWTLLLEEEVCEFICVHLYFGFIVGAEPCDFFPYGWHLKVSTWLGTYHGALVVILRILFCSLCSISMFDCDVVPHNGMP